MGDPFIFMVMQTNIHIGNFELALILELISLEPSSGFFFCRGIGLYYNWENDRKFSQEFG